MIKIRFYGNQIEDYEITHQVKTCVVPRVGDFVSVPGAMCCKVINVIYEYVDREGNTMDYLVIHVGLARLKAQKNE